MTNSLRTIFALDAILYALLFVWAWRAIHLPNEEPALTPAAAASPVGAHGDG
jgi:hypothetical protein